MEFEQAALSVSKFTRAQIHFQEFPNRCTAWGGECQRSDITPYILALENGHHNLCSEKGLTHTLSGIYSLSLSCLEMISLICMTQVERSHLDI